jgi:hypothetical protein
MKEYDLLDKYAIPKDELIAYRKTLTEGSDWVREPKGNKPAKLCPVIYTEDGVQKVLTRFGVNGSEPAQHEVKEFIGIVVRCDFPNPTIIWANQEGRELQYPFTVKVSNSRLFFKGARIKVQTKNGKFFCSQRPDSRIKLFNTQNPL